MRRSGLKAILLLSYLLCPIPEPLLRAEEAWPVPRGPSREPSPYRFDYQSLDKIPRHFLDDAAATILYAGSSYLLDKEGTIETIIHEVTRLNGRKGIEKLGEFRGITYSPSYQKLTLNEARIFKPSGTVLSIEPRHVQLRDVATDYQVYDQQKQLIISFPGLEVGDVLEVKWTTYGKNPEHEGQFFTRYPFGDPQYPVVLEECKVRLPRHRPLKFTMVNGTLEPALSEQGENRLLVWRMTNCPQLPREDHLPSKEQLRPTLLLSTFQNWKEIGSWKQKLRQECWKCTQEIRNIVHQVTRDLKTPAAKARALTYWVRRHIRYVSLGERHDYTPHLPHKVLANRFGDCKDTSQLLAVMLREAGIPVELATLGTRGDGQIHPDVPSPWGTHAILLVTLADSEHWIDTTTSLSSWDVLPRDDLDRLCYLTDPQGNLRLKRTPPLTPDLNRVEQLTEVWLGQDGTSRCRRTTTSHGLSAVQARDRFVEIPPGERRRDLTAELQDANSRTRLLRFQVHEPSLADFDKPVVFWTEFEIPRHFTGSLEKEGNVTDSKVWGRLLAYNIDHDRQTPMVLPAEFESLHTYRFHAPTLLAFEGLPRSKLIKSKWGFFRVEARPLENEEPLRHLELVFHTRLQQTRIEVKDLEAFRKFHEEVHREYRVWLTLRSVQDAAATSSLEHLLHLMPQNTEAARTLARIYLKGNRLEDAARILERACHYSPEESDLWELRVQTASDLATKELRQRDLANRYPKSPSYILEWASTLISLGLQDKAREQLQPLTQSTSATVRARAHYQLARSAYRLDQLNDALTQLELAQKAHAGTVNTVRVHVLRGQVLEELKRLGEAQQAYQQALNLDPENQEVLLSLIRTTLQRKDHLATLGYLRRYSLLVNKDVSGLNLAAETYLRLKRYDEAEELALRARDIHFHEQTQRILGLVYLARGEWHRARLHLQRADPDALVLTALLQSTIAEGNCRDLEPLLRRAEAFSPGSAALDHEIALGHAILQRRAAWRKQFKFPPEKEDEANRALDALACADRLAHEPKKDALVDQLLHLVRASNLRLGPAQALEGRRLFQQGKIRAALQRAELALTWSPDDPAGYHLRGMIRLETADRRATEDLEQAARLSQYREGQILADLADAHASSGDLDKAVQTARQALKLRPRDSALTRQLRLWEETLRKKQAG